MKLASMIQLIKKLSEQGDYKLTETIKLLLYKKNENIFENLDFENEVIYREPFLYTYFNTDDSVKLNSLLFEFLENRTIEMKTDNNGRFYIPWKGWFTTGLIEKEIILTKPDYNVFHNNQKVACFIENINYVNDTNIEILKYPLSFLEPFFTDVESNVVEVEIENITRLQENNLVKAYHIIKKYNPFFFELIERYAFKCVIFNTDFINKNSFAHPSIHGAVFYNAYQEDYDEIFFIDDISHQSAHVILTTLLFSNDDFFKIAKETCLQEVLTGKNIDIIENRTLEIVYHALFTYYFIFDNLDKVFTSASLSQRQRNEIIGRISLYILKCQNDFFLLDSLFDDLKDIFHEDALTIYYEMKKKFLETKNKYSDEFDFMDHPYNFTYKKFIEKNYI